MVFAAHVETLFFKKYIYTTEFKRMYRLSFIKQINRPRLEFLSR